MTIRASTLLGVTVVDRQGQRLGTVSDLLLDQQQNPSVCYALIDIEQTPGENGRTVAVPCGVLRPADSERQLVLAISREALRGLRQLDPP